MRVRKDPEGTQAATKKLVTLVAAFGERCQLPFAELAPHADDRGFSLISGDGSVIRVTVDAYLPAKKRVETP